MAATADVPVAFSSPVVDSLAEQLGVRAELPAIVEMTRCVFPETVVSIEIDDDPEIANDFHLAIVVRAARFTGQASVDAYRRWHRELSDVCPAPLKHVFRLSVEFDE
ncbi:MAG: hypothetical protein AABP62_12535 [Planctomycetota bacterium]